jgi:predicted aldo/keto reductase-like oxidoreductase
VWTNTLGRTGLPVSALACGSNALRLYDEVVANVVYNYALDHGITFIETGRMYDDGRTEEWIGKAVAHRRDEYVLASKCYGRLSYTEAARDLERSFQALQTDRIDNYRLAPVDTLDVLDKALSRDGALRAIEEAQASGRVGYTGITGHRPDVLMRALETGRFDTVLFVLNMGTYTAEKRALMELAETLDVGTMVMRPLAHGAFPPDPALRFALASGVDAVLCGMYSPLELDRNLTLAADPPGDTAWQRLRNDAASLGTGCTRCGGGAAVVPCRCPHGIDVRAIMTLIGVRARHGLLPDAESRWSTYAEAAKRCDDCRQCERGCPDTLSIVPRIRDAAATR